MLKQVLTREPKTKAKLFKVTTCFSIFWKKLKVIQTVSKPFVVKN